MQLNQIGPGFWEWVNTSNFGSTVSCFAAVEWLHSRGVVHKDIKPANIMVSLSGSIKLADFGVSEVEHDLVLQGLHACDVCGCPVQQ